MTKDVRVLITAIGSIGISAGLWTGLEFGANLDLGNAALVGVGLMAALAALGGFWIARGPSPEIESAPPEEEGGSTLKGVTLAFAGRDREWASIKAMVPRWRRKKTRVAVMIHGMPGVGKSEFAVYAAHKLEDELGRRHRVLARLIEFHGVGGVPATDPSDTLRSLLPDGSSPRLATMNLDQLSAEWRKYLHRKFLVLVLDDPGSEGQVKPFLPGGAPYIVLITGRRFLPGLVGRVRPYPLNVLAEDDAAQMIENIVGRTPDDDDRKAIAEIARLCGYHPKAIELAVSPLVHNSGFSYAARLAELNAHDNQLLAIDESVDEETLGVAHSFDLSYIQLPENDDKLVLRRLGLVPVPVISLEAATALVGHPVNEVNRSLGKLAAAALIDKSDEGFQLHDLIKEYARNLADRDDPAENRAAVNRLLSYYRAAAADADSLLTRQPPPAAIEPPAPSVRHDFPDHPSVIQWARAELPNLLACADYVVQNAEGNDRREENAWVVLFATALAGILRNESLWRRSIGLQTQAVTAAEKIQVPLAVANALTERGFLYRLTAQLELAAADLTQAISIYRETGGAAGRTGEAHALNTYGVVLDQQGKKDEGERRLAEALDLYRRLGDRLGEANVLHDQGMAELFAENGDREMAVRLLEQALDLFRTVDHPLGLAHAHSNLARAQQGAGDERAAADNLQSAYERYRDLGNRLGEVNVLVRRGTVLRQRDRGEAARALNEALSVGTKIENRSAQIEALDGLGELSMLAGDTDTALDNWSRALKIAREHAMDREEARLAAKLGRVRLGSPFHLRRPARRIGFPRRWNR